jgi:hypothetical protein
MDQKRIAAWLHFIFNQAVTLSERQYKASLGWIVATSTQHCGKYNDSDKTEELCQVHDKSLYLLLKQTPY